MPIVVYAQTMACNVTFASTAIQLAAGARNISVYVPSAASGADVRFVVSYDGGTTFVNLKYPPSSGTVAVGNVQIGSAITNAVVKVNELQGQEYIKAEYTTLVVNSSGTFRYIVEY
jgi:hypothetical protein